VIAYSYVIKNTGNVTLSGPFSVTDDKATASGGGVTSNLATATVNATLCKALSLIKTASPTTYSKAGDVISYSYVIRNVGNVTLAGPFSVTDNKATVTCTQPADGALSPNETMTCSASYTITAADMIARKVTNTAMASGSGATSNQATATVNAVQTKALSLIKTATPTTYSRIDDVISYSYEVKNTGNVALSGPFTVTDDKVTVTCPVTASLDPGASITCSASYTITQTDLDNGSVTNTATASGGGVTSNTATKTVNLANPTAVTVIDLQATVLSTGERLMALLRNWLQR
jgi:hypothetical protein